MLDSKPSNHNGTMKTVQTEYGPIHYEKMGEGPPLVVLHGGPGCESSYMIAGLRPISRWRTLYFFDQFGCGEDTNSPENANFDKTVEHALAFVRAMQISPSDVGLLGHSFGAQMALGMMKSLAGLRELILLNPVPPTASLWGKIKVDLSPEARDRIEKLTPIRTKEAGVEIINIYSQVYCEIWPPKVQFTYKAFDMQLCGRVQGSMGDFDFRPLLKQIPKQSLLLLGEKDFIRPELLIDYHPYFSEVIELERAKHMPFLDRPEDFSNAITPYFLKFR